MGVTTAATKAAYTFGVERDPLLSAAHGRKEGRKEGRKSLFGKVYINWWYLQYNNFSLGDHTKTAVRSLS